MFSPAHLTRHFRTRSGHDILVADDDLVPNHSPIIVLDLCVSFAFPFQVGFPQNKQSPKGSQSFLSVSIVAREFTLCALNVFDTSKGGDIELS